MATTYLTSGTDMTAERAEGTNGILIRFRLLRSDPNPVTAAPLWLNAIALGHYKEYGKRANAHAAKVLTRLSKL